MPFWRRREEDVSEIEPALQPAWQEAKDALPEGWTLLGTDHERFGLFRPGLGLDCWGASAEGPNGERTLAVARTEYDAYIQLARRVRGELEEADGWAPPVD
jgi:hypothetical protein